MKYLVVLLLAFSFTVTSCKKEDPPTKKEMISKTWKPKEVYVDGQLNSSSAWNAYRLEIKDNGTFIETSSQGSTSGVWEFNSDESKLLFNRGTAEEVTFDILTLNETQLRIKATGAGGSLEMVMDPA